MGTRITKKHLEAKVSIINSILGFEDPQWNTVGSVHLYCAYGGYGVHRVMNTSGGIDSLMELGTIREARQFLSGMIAALERVTEMNTQAQFDGAYHYAQNLGEDIGHVEARDFASWFRWHWPNGDVAAAWQAWLSALGTVR